MNKFKLHHLLFVLALIYFVLMSLQSSISGDEDIHLLFGQRVLDYFVSAGSDKSYLEGVRGGPDYAYNFTFDVLLKSLINIFNVEDPYVFRHMANSIVGWLIVLVASLLAKRYFGLPAFILTFLFLMFSPRFLGHSYNNPKDIPFAFGYILSIYSILKFSDALPKPTWKHSLEVGLCIGLCLNFRIGGLLLIPFFGLFVLSRLWIKRGKRFLDNKYWNQYGQIFIKGIVASIIAYTLMVIFWPFALESPLKNPFKSLEIMSDFAVGIRQLFDGSNVISTELPSNYIYKWMLMTIPSVILLGILILPFSFYKHRTKKRGFIIGCLTFSIIFPIAYAIAKSSNVYGGWRHFIFTYPPLVILSAAGYRYLIKTLATKNVNLKYGIYGLIAVLSIHPIWHIIKNHPVEYVYFNELSGGMNNAYGNYEMDYYMHSIRPAIMWMEQKGIINETDEIKIASNHRYSVAYYTRNYDNVSALYTRYYERLSKDWDYAIYVNVYIDQAELKNNQFPPTGTIHTIDVNGKPMAAIVKRPSKASLGYADDLKNGNNGLTKQKLLNYYAVDQNNFEANINLALVYNQIGQRDSLNYFLSEAKRVNPQRFSRYVKQ